MIVFENYQMFNDNTLKVYPIYPTAVTISTYTISIYKLCQEQKKSRKRRNSKLNWR